MLTLRNNSLDWALAHAERYGDTDVFPPAFEFNAARHDWGALGDYLSQVDVLQWETRAARRLLAPKGKYSFRAITQLDPLDFLLYAALVYEIGRDIESRRVPTSKKAVFSFRFSPDEEGRMFDPDLGYRSFQREAEARLEDDAELSHVAVADIADFYSSIYLHRLENALLAATERSNHVSAVVGLIRGWNSNETFGIPVGSAPSRLLAEITIADVDEALLGSGIPFVRYNDDYRLFGRSHDECFRHLATLADILHRNHGLFLAPQKTFVLSEGDFRRRFLPHSEDIALDSLRAKFDRLVDELDLATPYGSIDVEELDPDQRELLESLNLGELFREEVIGAEAPDINLGRFVLRRLEQTNDSALVPDLMDHLKELYPLFPDMVRYLQGLDDLDDKTKHDVGGVILDALEESLIGDLEYLRMWALHLFASGVNWNQEDRLYSLLSVYPDLFTKRKIILALGRAQKRFFFQKQWREILNESPWPRRAILAATSCLTKDAREHWYRSVEAKLDELELAVMRWARFHPFGSA